MPIHWTPCKIDGQKIDSNNKHSLQSLFMMAWRSNIQNHILHGVHEDSGSQL